VAGICVATEFKVLCNQSCSRNIFLLNCT